MSHLSPMTDDPRAVQRLRAVERPRRFVRGLAQRLAALCIVGGALVAPAHAQLRSDEVPRQLKGVEVVQRVGETVPLDLAFRDSTGKTVALGDYFAPGRPVLLTLNYSNCPQLCILQLDELAARVSTMQWTAGAEFQMVTVSIDPTETPAQAKRKQDLYAERYGRPGSEGGWDFLIGDQENITKLADAVGFGYRFDPETGEFAHDAALMVLTPSGVISRYVFGVMYDATALRLSMVEASEGKLGTIADGFMMVCFQYDPLSGTYVMAARRVMTIAGAITILVLGGLLLFLSRYRAGGNGPSNDGPANPRGGPRKAQTAQAT